ncbi:MAG: BspA family leucine-rich repeat surface protein [Clostridia bacterium]|nr:BspA family leucine-rich repeat surface protein [Clostridia bacterium]
MSKTDFQNGFALGMASGGVVEVIDTTEIDNLENLIDESGVLEDTEGTATEKVEQLIDKAEEVDVFRCAKGINFSYAKTFPSKAVINLPYVTSLHQAFANWSTEPIPIVEELTLNVPNITGMTQMLVFNSGVKKIILNGLDTCNNMSSAFHASSVLEEVVMNFSTKNVTNYASSFQQTYNLKRIIGTLDFSSATNVQGMFYACNNLEEVTFAPNTLSLTIGLPSNKLSANSVQSIIDGLATVETAQTLSLNKAIVLTDEQKSIINAKGWTLAQ